MKTALGSLAFLIGALALLLFLAPPLLGGWIARGVESGFEESREGRLEAGSVSLHWFRGQRVEDAVLRDPEGAEVLRGWVELPSIRDLLRAGLALQRGTPAELDPIRVRFDAELVVLDDGTTNLQRALAYRPGREPVEVERRHDPDGPLAGVLELLTAQVIVTSNRISVSTPETRATGLDYALTDLDARLLLSAGQPVRLTGSARLADDQRATVAAEGSAEGLRQTPEGIALESGELEARVQSLPTALAGALLGHEQDLAALLGPRADARLAASHARDRADRVELELSGERGSARFAFHEDQGVLTLDAAAPNEARLSVPRAWIVERLGPLLPEGARVAPTGEALELRLALRELSLPIPAPLVPSAFDPTSVRLVAHASLSGLELALAPPAEPAGAPAEEGERGPLELSLAGATLDLSHDPADGLLAALSVELEPEGHLAAELRAGELRWTPEGPAAGSARLEATMQRIPVALLGVPLGLGRDLEALIGPRADARLAAVWAPASGSSARVELEGQRARASFALLEQDGVLVLDAGEANEALLAVPRGWLAERLAPLLPEGVRVASVEPELEVGFALSELALALPAELGPGALDVASLLLAASARLGGLELAFAPPPAEGEAGEPRAPAVQRLSGGTLELRLDPGAGLVAALAAELDPEGRLALDARAGPEAVRAALAGEELRGLELDARAERLPTALADALAQQDGLLVDVLGDTLNAEAEVRELAFGLERAAPRGEGLQGEGPAGDVLPGGEPAGEEPGKGGIQGARLVARLQSDLGRVHFTGRIADGRLTAVEDEGLTATARLSPLLSDRIVGPLVPLLVSLGQPAGAEPIRISVRDLSLPLAGEPAGIRGIVRLELGLVTAQLLPSLSPYLSGVDELQPRQHRLLPFEVRVVDGVASYDALPIQIDGKLFELAGTYSLVDGRMDLRTSLPLHYLGGDVREALRAVSHLLPQDLELPVALVGTLSRPRLTVPDDAVGDLLRDAARRGVQDQLERGVQDRLKDILDRARRRDG